MSESPAYFLLAQFFTFMSLGLRLSLGFLALGAVAVLFKKHESLPAYWWGWASFFALSSGISAHLALKTMPYPNPFLSSGYHISWVVFSSSLGLIGLQRLRFKGSSILALFACLGLVFYLTLQPPFSRSNQIWLSVLFHLPVALSLGYFPTLFLKKTPQAFKQQYHSCSILSLIAVLGAHYIWLFPRLEPIPHVGEFYPYINLYDWFLWGFVILYLGNLYIDYWLRERPAVVQFIWNDLLLITGLVALWFNSSIFDTLAL